MYPEMLSDFDQPNFFAENLYYENNAQIMLYWLCGHYNP